MSKLAIIKAGGKQYLVEEKRKVKIEKIVGKTGDKIKFDALLIAGSNEVNIGVPLVKGKVEAKIIRQGRAKKVTGVKYKPKVRYAKKIGHRQSFTEVEIIKI